MADEKGGDVKLKRPRLDGGNHCAHIPLPQLLFFFIQGFNLKH